MALLPEDPRQQKSLLFVIVALAAGGLFYMYMYRPRAAELVEMEDRVAAIEHQNRLAESRIGSLQELRDRLAANERQFEVLEKLVPSRAEVPEIYASIATQTQELGVQLINVAPSQPVADSAAYFLNQNWEMHVKGEYHQIAQLLTRVASFDRIVRPQVREIRLAQEATEERPWVDVTFGLETYVLPPDTAGAEGGSE